MIFKKELADLRAAQRADVQLFESRVRAVLHAASPTRAVKKHPYAYMGAAALLGLAAPTPGGKDRKPSSRNDPHATRWIRHLLKKLFPTMAGLIPGPSAPPATPASVATPPSKSPAMMEGILAIAQIAVTMFANRSAGERVPPPAMQSGNAGSVATNAGDLNFHQEPSLDQERASHAGKAP